MCVKNTRKPCCRKETARCCKMVNGKWLPDFIQRLKASAWHQLYLPLLPFTHARSESINADSLKLQLHTARKKEWWPATADSLPQAVYLTTVKHTALELEGIEPTTFRSWVQRATSCATETTDNVFIELCVCARSEPANQIVGAINAYSSKKVKATVFKFDVHVSVHILYIHTWYFRKWDVITVTWPRHLKITWRR